MGSESRISALELPAAKSALSTWIASNRSEKRAVVERRLDPIDSMKSAIIIDATNECYIMPKSRFLVRGNVGLAAVTLSRSKLLSRQKL